MTSPTPRQLQILAWEVEIHSMRCIVFAATKAKAKWIAVKGYWEAYGKNGWPNPTAGRAELYDRSALRSHAKQRAWSEDHVISYPTL